MNLLAKIFVIVTAVIVMAGAPLVAQQPPNVVLIFADDLGYGDLGCYGATKLKTPNIDQLAIEGRRFTDAHSASAVCTPSRYGLLTGEYPMRALGGKGAWGPLSNSSKLIIDTETLTIGKVFKNKGYATACLGKWHLGFKNGKNDWQVPLTPGPLNVGFDHYFGVPLVNSGSPFVYVEDETILGHDPNDPLVPGGKPPSPTPRFPEEASVKSANRFGGALKAHQIYDDEKTGTLLTERAVKWITEKKDEPFFLYFPTPNIHHPFTPASKFKGTSECGLYGDFVHELDWMVGEILKCLDDNGLSENTLVIFTSDNGGMMNLAGRNAITAGHKINGDLLGFKFGAWEGGHRVPLIAKWPGRIKPGTESNQLISQIDMLATFTALTDQDPQILDGKDSINMLPVFVDEPEQPLRTELVLAPRQAKNLGMRKGKWVYIGARGSGGFSGGKPSQHAWGGAPAVQFAGGVNSDIENGRIKKDAPNGQLYDLEADPGQTTNLHDQYPEVVEELKAALAPYKEKPKKGPRNPRKKRNPPAKPVSPAESAEPVQPSGSGEPTTAGVPLRLTSSVQPGSCELAGSKKGDRIAPVASFVSTNASQATEVVSIQSLLSEMIDHDSVARFPAHNFRLRQTSSYNVASKTPDDPKGWFKNTDNNKRAGAKNFVRTEEVDGKTEWVLMDHEGAGAIVRTWMPWHNPNKGGSDITLRIYLDGAAEPTIEGNMLSIFEGKDLIPYPFAHTSLRSAVNFFPIPYAKRCKVTTTAKPFFHQLTYREYDEDTPVKTFSMSDFEAAKTLIEETGETLLNPTSGGVGEPFGFAGELASKAEKSVELPAGTAAVRELSVKLGSYADKEITRKVVLEIEFDGQQTVWCPIGDFFGSGIGLNPVQGWYRTVSEDGTMSCRWVMPYQKGGKVTLVNLSDAPVDAQLSVKTGEWNWDDSSMYFNASWRGQYPVSTRPYSDWNYVTLKGRGVYVADTLTVMNPTKTWWGEGDEKIWVDGEDFPSIFGTGTEDYYAYSWGGVSTDFYQHPFHAQPYCHKYNKVNRKASENEKNNSGYSVESRSRSLDTMPFGSSLQLDMEVWHWADCEMGYGVGMCWYGFAETTSNREPDIEEVLNVPPELTTNLPQRRKPAPKKAAPKKAPAKTSSSSFENSVEIGAQNVVAKPDSITLKPRRN